MGKQLPTNQWILTIRVGQLTLVILYTDWIISGMSPVNLKLISLIREIEHGLVTIYVYLCLFTDLNRFLMIENLFLKQSTWLYTFILIQKFKGLACVGCQFCHMGFGWVWWNQSKEENTMLIYFRLIFHLKFIVGLKLIIPEDPSLIIKHPAEYTYSIEYW